MTIDTIVSLVKQHGPQLVARLGADGGLTRPEAERFVPVASTAVVRALEGVDAGASAEGKIESLRDRLNVGALAAKARIDEDKVAPALATFLPSLLELVGPGTGALARLLGNARGGDGRSEAASIAKKFFKTP